MRMYTYIYIYIYIYIFCIYCYHYCYCMHDTVCLLVTDARPKTRCPGARRSTRSTRRRPRTIHVYMYIYIYICMSGSADSWATATSSTRWISWTACTSSIRSTLDALLGIQC